MATVIDFPRACFAVGDVVQHKKFAYRGVIADVDPRFRLSEEWYDAVATSRPPKNKPWYHVLVDGAEHTTYVAERHLALDDSGDPIQHPLLEQVFSRFEDGRYIREINS